MNGKLLKSFEIYCDGGSLGNSKTDGVAYGSWAIYAIMPKGPELGKQEKTDMPHLNTNNEAEYQALINALTYLKGLQQRMGRQVSTTVYMDSKLVVDSMTGGKMKAQNLIPLRDQARELLTATGATIERISGESMKVVLGH